MRATFSSCFFCANMLVVGFDISKWRIDELSSGYDRTLELSNEQVNEAIKTMV